VDADGKLPAVFAARATNTFEDLKRSYYTTDIANTAAESRRIGAYLDMEYPPAATLVQAGSDLLQKSTPSRYCRNDGRAGRDMLSTNVFNGDAVTTLPAFDGLRRALFSGR